MKTNFFSQDEIDFLMSQKDGANYVVLYQMLCLATVNNNGELSTKLGEMIVPYEVEKIVRDTKYFNKDTVVIALGLFKKLGMIYEEQESGLLRIANYEEMVGSESSSAKRVREWRQKKNEEKALQCNTDVTLQSNYIETQEYRDKSIEIRDKSIEIEKEPLKRESYVSIIESYTENEELKDSIKGYVEMRQKMKGFTVRALKMGLKKLDEIAGDDETKIAIVNQSIEHSWKSFYPLSYSSKKEPDRFAGFAF